ncbi:MAG: hypothetical protein WEB56_09980 [Roseovarius sp.]
MMADDQNSNISRRRMLAKLGLATGVAYVAPAMMHLSAAHASGGSGGGGAGGGSGGGSGGGRGGSGGSGGGRGGGSGGSGPSGGRRGGSSGPSGRSNRSGLGFGQAVRGALNDLGF